MNRLLSTWLPKQWSKLTMWHFVLLPISYLFRVIVIGRTLLYKIGFLPSYAMPVPVVVVGNINVGGTGKTPLVIHLVEQLQAQGLNPGVISRGYRGAANHIIAVTQDSDVDKVGDEPLLIARRSRCPVFVGRNRIKAAQALLANHPECDIIISDDGLQHYRLRRDFEIVVVDGKAGFGNQALLPAGPLRESVRRLDSVDLVVVNGQWQSAVSLDSITKTTAYSMRLHAANFYNLKDNGLIGGAEVFANKTITAVAGIGNPSRFFEQLTQDELTYHQKAFPDHHAFKLSDFKNINTDVILMTEKDAVKCQTFAKSNYWVLPINAVLSHSIVDRIINTLKVTQ